MRDPRALFTRSYRVRMLQRRLYMLEGDTPMLSLKVLSIDSASICLMSDMLNNVLCGTKVRI